MAAGPAAASAAARRADVAIVAAPRTDVVLFATRGGACATRPLDGRVSRVPLNVGAGDAVATAIFTDTESELNAYTSDGQVLRLRVADVPIESRVSRGVKAVALSRGSELVGLLPLAPAGGHVLLVTERGEIKRSEAAIFAGLPHGRLAGDRPAGRRSRGRRGRATATATRSCCTRRTAARCGSTRARCGRSRARRRAAWRA